MGETFWQKNSLITRILFELWLIMIFRPVANFAQQSLSENYLDFCNQTKVGQYGFLNHESYYTG